MEISSGTFSSISSFMWLLGFFFRLCVYVPNDHNEAGKISCHDLAIRVAVIFGRNKLHCSFDYKYIVRSMVVAAAALHLNARCYGYHRFSHSLARGWIFSKTKSAVSMDDLFILNLLTKLFFFLELHLVGGAIKFHSSHRKRHTICIVLLSSGEMYSFGAKKSPTAECRNRENLMCCLSLKQTHTKNKQTKQANALSMLAYLLITLWFYCCIQYENAYTACKRHGHGAFVTFEWVTKVKLYSICLTFFWFIFQQ